MAVSFAVAGDAGFGLSRLLIVCPILKYAERAEPNNPSLLPLVSEVAERQHPRTWLAASKRSMADQGLGT